MWIRKGNNPLPGTSPAAGKQLVSFSLEQSFWWDCTHQSNGTKTRLLISLKNTPQTFRHTLTKLFLKSPAKHMESSGCREFHEVPWSSLQILWREPKCEEKPPKPRNVSLQNLIQPCREREILQQLLNVKGISLSYLPSILGYPATQTCVQIPPADLSSSILTGNSLHTEPCLILLLPGFHVSAGVLK